MGASGKHAGGGGGMHLLALQTPYRSIRVTNADE